MLNLLHRTPLAWYNLTYEKRRLITALSGVSFAVLLMFMFTGFQNALYDSQLQLLQLLNGDIVIVNRLKYNMFVPDQFAQKRLYQAQAFEGVAAAYPLYTTTANWKNPETRAVRPLRVLAFNPQDPVLPLPGILDHLDDITQPWTVLMDTGARPEIGSKQVGTQTEIADRRVEVVGTFTLGTDFASINGNVVMSDQNFLRYFANLGPEEDSRTLDTVDIGLIKLKPGTSTERMAQALRQHLPADVSVLTKDEFVQRELSHWQENTNIGFVFSLLTTMSFVVGVILVYQILYADVADHWAEYATLRAMGYSNGYLFGVVLQESLLLAILGFIPGGLVSVVLYRLMANATGLVMQLTAHRVTSLLITTFIMCLASGLVAVRKVQTTDPAEVF